MTRDKLSLFLYFFVCLTYVYSIEDYCLKNNFGSNDTFMEFTKEANVQEFAIVGKFKGLHCCAKNYRSIEWYKDGQPYPWPLNMSQLILYPESVNQTVYAKSVTESDSGNYTCILRNDTVVHSHTIVLKVFAKVPDEPQITYISPNATVPTGHHVRLFCEAFAGLIDLPDAHNEAIWSKVGSNKTLFNESRIKQEKISREGDQTFGTYLQIQNIQPEDFGTYVCKISKPGKTVEQYVAIKETIKVKYLHPNPLPVFKLLVLTITICLLIVALLILNIRYGLKLRVRYKDSFGPLEMDDGKKDDALILYCDQDADIALNILLPKLESSYGYKCGCRKIDGSVEIWVPEVRRIADKSRRIIMVFSKSALNNSWDTQTAYNTIKHLLSLGPKIICIATEDLPKNSLETKNEQGETLKSVLSLVYVINWMRPLNDKWWLNLCLRMPPKRHTSNKQENNAIRLNSINRQESLDNLV